MLITTNTSVVFNSSEEHLPKTVIYLSLNSAVIDNAHYGENQTRVQQANLRHSRTFCEAYPSEKNLGKIKIYLTDNALDVVLYKYLVSSA